MNTRTIAIWQGVTALAVVALVATFFLIGLTTHASHVKDLKYAHDEMLACIHTSRTAAECRVIVYGSY